MSEIYNEIYLSYTVATLLYIAYKRFTAILRRLTT